MSNGFLHFVEVGAEAVEVVFGGALGGVARNGSFEIDAKHEEIARAEVVLGDVEAKRFSEGGIVDTLGERACTLACGHETAFREKFEAFADDEAAHLKVLREFAFWGQLLVRLKRVEDETFELRRNGFREGGAVGWLEGLRGAWVWVHGMRSVSIVTIDPLVKWSYHIGGGFVA